MIVIIGILNEKPSQARNFSAALGGMSGTYNGEKYVITSARGHLYGFPKNPDKMVDDSKINYYKYWNLKNLPWDENDFNWKYEKLDDTAKTLSNIKKTLSACDEICIATDDDPTGEGELLAWEIISQLHLKASRYTRMYFEDESKPSIQKAFKNRKTLGSSLDCMHSDPDYKQAIFRTKWDYISMQWTRMATEINHVNKQVLRAGRLKTAMVKMVGDQLKAVKEYVKKPYYQSRFKDENENVYTSENEKKYDRKEDVPFDFKESEVVCDSKVLKSTAPPKFLDLSSLSALLSAKGYKAEDILKTYQRMYEDNVVSYPRTEDHYITEEQFKQLLPYVDMIAQLVDVNPLLLTHRIPRKTHIKTGMAHGANRPGTNVPISLDELNDKYGTGAKEIYKLLARNYLATLCEDYEYEHQEGHLKEYPDFKATANPPCKPGWKAVYDVDSDDDKKINKCLGTVAVPFIYEGANPKPKQPTMKWLMKQLEKRNVGTGATRTSIYADVTNQKTRYPLLIDKNGKLSFAKCGESEYRLLPGTHIGDLTLTENVMEEMNQIKAGTLREMPALHRIQSMIYEDIQTMMKNAGITEFPEHQKTSDSQKSAERFTGVWSETGETVSIKKIWGKHIFTNEELQKLLDGESITFPYNGNSITGRLAEQTYNGHQFVGFKKDENTSSKTNSYSQSPDKISGTWVKTGKTVSIKKSWGQHDFTRKELQDLFNGKVISFEYNGRTVKGQLAEQTYNGHKFVGFKSLFKKG